MNNTVILKNLELHKDAFGYFLSAEYLIEDDKRVKEIRFPRLNLRINTHQFCIRTEYGQTYVDIGLYDDLLAQPEIDQKTGRRVAFIEEILEEKTKEMTVAEIEKKLGHKIKIISEDKKHG